MRANLKWKLVTQVVGSMLVLMLAIGMTSCDRSTTAKMPDESVEINSVDPLATTDGPLSEVNIPASIAKLAPNVDKFRPRVKIISPQADRILNDDRVDVKLQVSDLPIFKHPELGLGNHLHVILDKQTYQGVYDLNQPLVFKNLAAGTHTLRVFASRPWHESFKNEGAYAQVTFHVLTKTAENNPDPQQPLLTYSRPTGIYGAEPIMLDYYLTNAPTHVSANGTSEQIPDWKIRATVNNQQFIIDRWTPVYLQGFKPGKNWVRLELVDDRGHPLPNIYNDTTSIITYDPQAKDTLAKLVSGELDPNLTGALIDPNYVATTPELVPIPVAIPAPVQAPTPSPTPAISTPPSTVKPTPSPIPSTTVEPIPSPILVAPAQPLPQSLPPNNDLGRANPAPANVPALQPQEMPSPAIPAPIPNSNQIPTVTQPIVIPNPVTVQMPTVTGLAQPYPSTPPVPNPAQIKIEPAPILVAPPIPMATPVPSPIITNPAPTAILPPSPVAIVPAPVAQNPVVVVPQPTIVPSPAVASQPSIVPFTPATSIRSTPNNPPTSPATHPEQQVAQTPSNGLPSVITIAPAPLPQQNPALVALPVPATPQVEGDRSDRTWQTQAIELIKIAGVKIRAFTNTIPGKAQRFGHNVQIWTGKAIETIQSWRDRP